VSGTARGQMSFCGDRHPFLKVLRNVGTFLLIIRINFKIDQGVDCMLNENTCPKCNSTEFAEGTDFMGIKPLDKKFSIISSNKIYTFCLKCGEVVSTRIENPGKFKNVK
jgi:predicted nucleic-acid-binding Zn-ribbon protein